MREIKFRGRGTLGWHIGLVTTYKPDCGLVIIDNVFEVDPATVGQFTGLFDRDGREIYEGDVVRDTEGRIFKAVWNTGAGAWEMVNDKLHWLFIMTYPDLYKVIGNVHDNPELMESSQHD